MKKEKDPVNILLSEAFPQKRDELGPCKITWHHTNKQMAFEFMADNTVLIFDAEQQQLIFDPVLLKVVLGREQVEKEQKIGYLATTVMMLECRLHNPDYGEQIAKRFIKRLIKNWGPQQVMLVPNYGLATTAQSMLFWRAIPCVVTARQIMFHILPSDKGERTRRGL